MAWIARVTLFTMQIWATFSASSLWHVRLDSSKG